MGVEWRRRGGGAAVVVRRDGVAVVVRPNVGKRLLEGKEVEDVVARKNAAAGLAWFSWDPGSDRGSES